MLARSTPGRKAGGEVTGARPANAAEQFAQIAKPAAIRALGKVRIDRVTDDCSVFEIDLRSMHRKQARQPFGQKCPVLGAVRQRERIEARRFTGTKHVVLSPDCADEIL